MQQCRLLYSLVTAPSVAFTLPPSTIAADDQLRLETELHFDPRTSTADLTFAWSCSDPSIDLRSTLLLAGLANSNVLTLKNGVLPAGTYTFSVVVTDTNPLRRVDGAPPTQPTASVSVTVTVTAAVQYSVPVVVGVDPCVTQSPCLNGGRCVATLVPGADITAAASYTLSCICPTTPFTFFGPSCSFAVLACPNCVSAFAGGSLLTVYGVGFGSLRAVHLAGQLVSISSPTFVDARNGSVVTSLLATLNQPQVTTLQSFSFRSPAIHVNQTYRPSSMQRALAQISAPSTFPASYETLMMTPLLPSTSTTLDINYT